MAGAAAVIGAVGLFANAFGTIKQGRAQASNFEGAAAAADQNAIIEEENAAIQISLSRQANQRFRSTQRAATAGAGLKLEGSPLLVELEAARIGAFEVEQLQRASVQRAANLRGSARQLRTSAKRTRQAALIKATGTLLTGGAQIATSGAKGMF